MLIISAESDPHARAVAWAMERNGIAVQWLDLCGAPENSMLDYYVDMRSEQMRCNRARALPTSVAWFRRTGSLRFKEGLQEPELSFARRECEHQIQSMLLRLEATSKMTNRFSSSRACRYKAYQIGVARSIGVPVPRTLVSNNPNSIRDFFFACDGRIVYKPMSLPFFSRDGRRVVLETTRLSEEMLNDDNLLSTAPGLFQEEIIKVAEYRVLMLPDRSVTLRFEPEDVCGVDWRGAHRSGKCDLVALPEQAEQACRSLLIQLGLDYGCIDLALNTEGDIIFLEVNSEGQFLFMESRVPECRVLEHFVSFLMRVGGRADASVPLSLAEFDIGHA